MSQITHDRKKMLWENKCNEMVEIGWHWNYMRRLLTELGIKHEVATHPSVGIDELGNFAPAWVRVLEVKSISLGRGIDLVASLKYANSNLEEQLLICAEAALRDDYTKSLRKAVVNYSGIISRYLEEQSL